MCDPLVPIPTEQWTDLRNELRKYGVKGIPGCSLIDIETDFTRVNNFPCRIYCPYGKLSNGFVRITQAANDCKIDIIHCTQDTTEVKEALRSTKRIDWQRPVEILCAAEHANDAFHAVMADKNLKYCATKRLETFYINEDAPYYDIIFPPGLNIRLLTMENAQLVNDMWPHRHAASLNYYKWLIAAKLGYGLFLNNVLTAWCFVRDDGSLGHIYTLEQHRRKGYGELVLKSISNVLRKQGKRVVAHCAIDNERGRKMYVKAGFAVGGYAEWCLVQPG